jgi:voltage-gated potassium channel
VGDSTAHNEPTSAALERIHRLEKVERARIERELAKKHRQAETADVRHGATDDRREWLEHLERRIRFPMAAVGVAWAVVGVIVLTTNVSGITPEALVVTLFVLWLVVLGECLFRYIVVPNRRRYFSSRRIEPVMVAFPLFQLGRVAGVEKVTVVAGEGAERFFAILKHRGLFRVLLVALGLLIIGAILVMLFERNAAGSNIHNFQDAIWWAIVTVTTVGYGDRYPVSEGGRAVAVILMFVGIGLIGTLTATVASFFVQEHTDANKAQLQAAHEDLGARLTDIDTRLARIETALGDGGPAPEANGSS